MKPCLGTKRGREEESDNAKGRVETFWTICPYCYYLYEYEIVYLDCCLRCQNCKKAFHAVAIKGPLPEITMVEGKELYNVNLALFKVCYSSNEGTKVDVDSNSTLGYNTEDFVNVDVGSNNIQRRRVIANHADKSGHLNIKEFCKQLRKKLGTIHEDDPAEQEIKQSQSRSGGELSNVQTVGTGERVRGGLVADHLENGLNGELEYDMDSKSGELEYYMDDDDIYVGLADL